MSRHGERKVNVMNETQARRGNILAYLMLALGVVGAAVTVLLRAWLIPSQRDIETGLFTTNFIVMLVVVFILMLLGGAACLLRGGERREISGKPALLLALVLLGAGIATTAFALLDLLARLEIIDFYNITNEILGDNETNPMRIALQWLQPSLGMLSGVVFARLGLVLASEGSTRRGMAQWGMLIPVLWQWVVLANYEMSYASMVRLSDGFFSLGMYVMEMLFLLFFARYVSGVGKVGHATMLFFSTGAVVCVLSAPLVRVAMYLQQDGEAYAAAGAAGPLDMVVGLLALTVSIAICQGLAPVSEESAKFTSELVEGFGEFDVE